METKKVKDLERFDAVDLEGDKYADPDNNEAYLADHWVIVDGKEKEAPDCIRVDFDYFSVGFPPDYEVPVKDIHTKP